MVNTYEGLLTVSEEKFCIIISRFNEFIGSKLLSGAIDELKRHGVDENNIDVAVSAINKSLDNKTLILVTHSKEEVEKLGCKIVEFNSFD
jgi:hypothetical protein